MPTLKNRLNITLPEDVEEFLNFTAKTDKTPKSKKVVALLKFALEMGEDAYLYELCKERDTKGVKWISHKDFWKKYGL